MRLATPKLAFFWLALAGWLGGAMAALAGSPDGFAAYARGVFDKALVLWQNEPANPRAAWELGRACFDLAEFATNHTERAEIAERGITACRRALTQASNSPAVHYYLAMNLAQLARTKSLSALKIVGQMRDEYETARRLDERIDYAGPDRYLGMLYRDAPSIISIGDRGRAQQHLEHAVARAPEYPDNHLALIESYLKWGERGNARRQLAAFAATRAASRTALAGPAWASHWVEWDADFARYEKQAVDPPKALQPIKDRR